MNGTVTTATRLMMPVSEIESARSPLPYFVSTLEVTPPGQSDRIMTPIASSGGRLKITASA